MSMITIYSYEFAELCVAEQYFALAKSYLDSSKVLCEHLIEKRESRSFSNTRVILYTARHSIELFLKGTLFIAGVVIRNNHSFVDILEEYSKVYVGDIYEIRIPFGIEILGTAEHKVQANEITAYFHRDHDQRYRYPTDNRGKIFCSNESFMPQAFLNQIIDIDEDFSRIKTKLSTE